MTIALWSVLLAGLLPYGALFFVKNTHAYDNADPRSWEEKLQGRHRRAYNAHLNGFEAFPLFAAAVLAAQQMQARQGLVDVLAMAFVAARIAYLWAYVADRASLRSVIWLAGFLVAIAIFLTPLLR